MPEGAGSHTRPQIHPPLGPRPAQGRHRGLGGGGLHVCARHRRTSQHRTGRGGQHRRGTNRGHQAAGIVRRHRPHPRRHPARRGRHRHRCQGAGLARPHPHRLQAQRHQTLDPACILPVPLQQALDQHRGRRAAHQRATRRARQPGLRLPQAPHGRGGVGRAHRADLAHHARGGHRHQALLPRPGPFQARARGTQPQAVLHVQVSLDARERA